MVGVEEFYDDAAENEWQRLERHRTELAVTLRALGDHLPEPPAKVLDVGGGPGRYSIALARLGYQVTLLDLSQKSLEFAARKAREAGVDFSARMHGNALDLSQFHEDAFDAVLVLGPLYHLTQPADRRKAVQEALRVLKPGGPLFAAWVTRYAAFRDVAAYYPETLEGEIEQWEQLWVDGINFGPDWTDAYFAMPGEIIPFMESCGLQTITMLGLEGIADGHEDKLNLLDGPMWDYWVDRNYRFAHDSDLWAASAHLLYIGQKSHL